MDNIGKIEKIDGNMAVISVKRVSACGDSCKSCGSSCKVNSVIFETDISDVEDEIYVGDYVEIRAENEVMLKHIAVLYGLPLLLMLSTVFIFQMILKGPNKDIISAVASLFSLIISFYLLKAYDKSEMKKNALKFTVGKKL
ncbi:MAG: SoxR reducing system RseC family protein [Tissierellia bacterium]|nr:SoxR reducing system RseC family protein [Tissierellia bacterium]MDD3751338.1 SoxR reducing system RseC family protein [Tissierellia bacterium]MDD4046493.1 SoxR reducing system RseC family protein [Tissierellia bacterium]MDD4678927.1 SoxR reducing system RseC family protein [Tissierellia bacterium]